MLLLILKTLYSLTCENLNKHMQDSDILSSEHVSLSWESYFILT